MQSEHLIHLTEHRIDADPKAIDPVRQHFIEFLLSLGLDDSEKESWKLTFSEALNNAIEHGCANDPSQSVWVRWWSVGKSVWLETQDEGSGPDAEQEENPTLPDDPLAEGGRGLFIIHNFADDFIHWRSRSGYIARIGKSYERLNDVLPQNAEMDAILDELSDCYESLSLYDRLAENLIEDERVNHFVESSLESFLGARDYTAIHLELRPQKQSEVFDSIMELDHHGRMGQLKSSAWETLVKQESLAWRAETAEEIFESSRSFPVGTAVTVKVNDESAGLIAVAYEDPQRVIRSNDIRNLRALADIIGIALSRAVRVQEQDERKRLATELDIATQLQRQLLPVATGSISIPGYQIFTDSKSALSIAGDFVEFRMNSAGEYLGCVIDVMGKGISAAILAGIFRSQFIAFSERGGKLSNFLNGTNQALEQQLGEATMFITAFVFKLNSETHEVSYAAAGHPPALLFSEGGAKRQLFSQGPPIGLFKEVDYSKESFPIAPGDRLIVVTDGLYEWSTGPQAIFGWEAMVDWFAQRQGAAPEQAWADFQRLICESRKSSKQKQADDESILMLTRESDHEKSNCSR